MTEKNTVIQATAISGDVIEIDISNEALAPFRDADGNAVNRGDKVRRGLDIYRYIAGVAPAIKASESTNGKMVLWHSWEKGSTEDLTCVLPGDFFRKVS